MQEVKQIYQNLRQKENDKTKKTPQFLVSFECMICLNEFDNGIFQPILICENQHNMCKKCVEQRNFQKSKLHPSFQKQQKHGEFCPLCAEQIDESKLRTNNLLLEIYSWIQNVSKRQNQKIQIIRKDFEEVQLEYKKNLLHLNQKNQELLTCVQILSRQNELLKSRLNLKIGEKDVEVDQEKIIREYEILISDLKEKLHLRKIKALKAITQINHTFQIDTLHKHFEKFKLQPNNCIEMQGPFYRSFFESLNFYYNVMSSNGIKMEDFEENENLTIKFSFQIVETKKGHFYIGFCNKAVAYEINPHSYKNFIGFCVEDCEILQRSKRILTKLTKIRPKVYKGMVIEIQIKKQAAYWKVNKQLVFECSTTDLFETESTSEIFPIVSMQMVGDKVKIIKEK